MHLSLRPLRSDDEPWLARLYASTRAEELDAWGWDAAQREAFLRFQFAAFQQHYHSRGDRAERHIVEIDAQPAGQLIIERSPDAVTLADIALLPEYRNRGAGTVLVRDLLDEAARDGKAARLHVRRDNRAQRLFARLGFVVIEDDGLYRLMQWQAA